MKTIGLSPSKLGVLRECPRCFWDANNLKVPQPRGIFPSLPGGVDRVMKAYSDTFRGSMIPELSAVLQGKFWGTVQQIEKFRNWKSGLKAEVRVGDTVVNLIGALDDLVVHENQTHSPFDWKTKGDIPRDDGSQYYQSQLDLYSLMLRENGMPPSGKAYLCYWYPVQSIGGSMTFKHMLYELTASPERAIELLTKAVGILAGGQPTSNPGCEYCRFAQARVEVAVKAIAQPALSLSA
jgi:PD-(D/E)XK nuclease superfamily protein